MRKKSLVPVLWVVLVLLSGGAHAQSWLVASSSAVDSLPPAIVSAPVLPRMSAELALDTYQRRMRDQAYQLSNYSDTTVMQAELPDTSQKAEYELRRRYAAPKTLEFTPVRFSGDGFVKSNVLIRLLQSEVDHVTKEQASQTAIDEENYKFNLKSVEEIDGRFCYLFQVRPREKRVGLFKGRVYIDAQTGALRRAEGTLVKSPSWWIKKVEFVQDYDEIGGFNLPVKLHSVTRARVIGRAIVNVFHRDYQAIAAATPSPERTSDAGSN